MPKPKRWLLALVVVVVLATAAIVFLTQLRDSRVDPDSPAAAGFGDIAKDAGIYFRMGFLPGEQGPTFKINLYDHGCGVAVGDYNGDGRDDLYFLNQLGANALLRNKGNCRFEDVTEEMGVALDDRICVAATFADYDNDGDQDLYVTSTRGGNVLFRNERGRKFTDVTAEAGLELVGHSQTAAFFDYNKDARLDLYIAQTAAWTTDEYDDVAGYYVGKGAGTQVVIDAPKEYNRLYRNEGNGKFTDMTEAAGLRGRGWSGDIAVFDYDEDGWQDLLVVSMFGRAQLYRNLQNETFADVTLEVLGKTPFGGTGAKVFDYNNDGKLDIYIVNMHSDMWMGLDPRHVSLSTAVESEKFKFPHFFGPHVEDQPSLQEMERDLETKLDFRHDEVLFGNAFYEWQAPGKYKEVSAETNTETFWPWGVATGDFDNDGFEDAFVTAGMGYPFYYWRNYLLMNDRRGAFREESFSLGIEPPALGRFLPEKIEGVDAARSSRCTAAANFDGDGRLEIVTNNFNDRPYFFKNGLPSQSYVALRLRGTRSNRDAIGALVRIKRGDEVLLRQVHAAGGYLSQSSKTIHFGLGKKEELGPVEIVWPSGIRQTLEGLAPNRLHEVTEPDVEISRGVVHSGQRA